MNKGTIKETKTFALGDGLWSIEVFDHDGSVVKEFVGSNGTRDEEADDLWALYQKWYNALPEAPEPPFVVAFECHCGQGGCYTYSDGSTGCSM
jgi:hypothetical protein